MTKFQKLIVDTGGLQLKSLPDDLGEAFLMLMCERTYLVGLLKGLLQ